MAQQPHAPYHPAPPVHPVDEKPAAKRLGPAALQHIAAMYAGVVTPPPLTAVQLHLFFPPLGTRSTSRTAVLSAASSGSGTQIPWGHAVPKAQYRK
ncbi:hypothetical protein [Streptomyces sp. NPDC054765]